MKIKLIQKKNKIYFEEHLQLQPPKEPHSRDSIKRGRSPVFGEKQTSERVYKWKDNGLNIHQNK